MINELSMKYETFSNITLESDGHYHILVPAFFNFDDLLNDSIDFVFDTGAFLTVISNRTAKRFKFVENFPTICSISLSGFTGKQMVDIKNIPGVIIGNKRLSGVKVAIPREDSGMSILGLNILENFKYYLDSENDRIYFAQNNKPEIKDEFLCDSILSINSKANDRSLRLDKIK